MNSRSARLLSLTLIGILAPAGCVQPMTARVTLPASHTVVRDQLVIHTDFPLAAKHRLLEDLTARRTDLTNRLGVPTSDEPIHVYLFQNAKVFEGFVRLYYPPFARRRAYFVETDTQLRVYAQWGDRVAEDLRHEVTHAYLHSVVPNLPLWLDEGLAEYFEVPRGSRGLNRSHLEQLAAELQRDAWHPELEQLESLGRPFEMTQPQYAESWAWVHFLLETGPEHRELLQRYLQDLRRQGSAEPLSKRIARRLVDPDRHLVEHVRYVATLARLWPASRSDRVVARGPGSSFGAR
jgi:hypothetical protein